MEDYRTCRPGTNRPVAYPITEGSVARLFFYHARPPGEGDGNFVDAYRNVSQDAEAQSTRTGVERIVRSEIQRSSEGWGALVP